MTEQVFDEWEFTSADLDKWTTITGGVSRLTEGINIIVGNKPMMSK